MKADLAKLRALLSESCCAEPWRLIELTQTVVSGQSHPLAEISAPGHRLTFHRKTGREGELIVAAVNALPELLAIAEAVERAPVVDIYDSRAHGWTVDGDIPDKLNGISVRLLAIGEDGNVQQD